MARARAAEQQRSKSKNALIEETTLGITRLQEVAATIQDISQEGFPYRDAAQSKAELQFRECLRQAFGERSPEFQAHRNFKIRTADKSEVTRTLAVLKGLINTLEDRKLELQGLKPPHKPEPQLEAPPTNTVRMTLVPSTAPPTTTLTMSPITFATAVLKDIEPPTAPATPTPQVQSTSSNPFIPTPIPPSTVNPAAIQAPPPAPQLAHAPPPIPVSMPTASLPPPTISQTPAPTPTPVSTPVVQSAPSVPHPPVAETPVQPPAIPMPTVSAVPAQPSIQTHTAATPSPSTRSELSQSPTSTTQDSSSDKLATGPSPAQSIEPEPDQDPLQLVWKVCLRLHAVARQLRLRRDYRPTLEIEDDHDLQDLLCALLKLEFDEVATEEWTPPYTEGTPRTMLLINRDQIAVVAKKTRAGLGAKELADQVTADSAYYRAQGRGSTLLCFMYDPEGRIGSPKRLETTLTSVSEHCRVEVLVAPK